MTTKRILACLVIVAAVSVSTVHAQQSADPRVADIVHAGKLRVGLGVGCRFQKLDSCVPVMQSAQDCMCDNVSEGLDRASVGCILPKRNMRTPPVIIGGEFRKNPPQVLFVEHDQMIGTLAPDRPDQAFNMTVLPGRAE